MIVSIFQIYFFRCIKFPDCYNDLVDNNFLFNSNITLFLLIHFIFQIYCYTCFLSFIAFVLNMFFFYFLNFLCHFKFVSWLRAYSCFFLFFFCNPGLFYLEAHSLFCIILGLFPFILCFY